LDRISFGQGSYFIGEEISLSIRVIGQRRTVDPGFGCACQAPPGAPRELAWWTSVREGGRVPGEIAARSGALEEEIAVFANQISKDQKSLK